MADKYEARRIQRVAVVLVVLFRILAIEAVGNDFAVSDHADTVTLL